MKKRIALFMVAVIICLLCGCGKSVNTVNKYNEVGEELESDDFKFTLKETVFTDKMLICKGDAFSKSIYGNDENFFTPCQEPLVDEDGYLIKGIHGFSVSKGADAIYLYYDLEFKYIGKTSLRSVENSFKPILKYGDYIFESDYMSFIRKIEGHQIYSHVWSNLNENGDFNWQVIEALRLDFGSYREELKPLTNDVYEVRGIIKVPKTIVEDREEDIVLKICEKDFKVG